MKKILIITGKEDMHPSSVINILRENGMPYFRLNTEDLLVDYDFIWFHHNNDVPDFYIKDKTNGSDIWGHDVLSVWYRKPDEPLNLPISNSQEIDKHNLAEARQFFIYLMHYLSEVYSIGNHFFDKRANSKLLQSKIAAELGMPIPDTCLSNNKDLLLSFANQYDSIGIKPLRNYWVLSDDGKVYELCTKKISYDSLCNQPVESFSQTVTFIQKYIDKKYELRVTVMGPYIFTCKLYSQLLTESTGAVDWRQGYNHGLKHEIIETPQEIAIFCRKYLQKFQLNFGCFDFIVTQEGGFVFLECNPNGQWGWIEDECKVPMSEALVDCLVNCLYV